MTAVVDLMTAILLPAAAILGSMAIIAICVGLVVITGMWIIGVLRG